MPRRRRIRSGLIGDRRVWIAPHWWLIVSLILAISLTALAVWWLQGWARWSSLVGGIVVCWILISRILRYSIINVRDRDERIVITLTHGLTLGVGVSRGEIRVIPDLPLGTPIIDRDVRFTVYHPSLARPEVWNTLLAFAYRAADLAEGGGDLRTSSEEVKRQADKILGALSVIKIIQSAPIRIIDRVSLPQRCHLSIGVPIVQGLALR